MNELVKWLNKDLKDINKEYLFLHFFNNIILNEKDIDVFYLSNYDKGIELVLSKLYIVQSIHFFGTSNTEQRQFKEELPLQIEFSFSRKKIISLLGIPKKSGGGYHNILIGFIREWDKYYFSDYSLRFEYSIEKTEIVLITIASLTLENVLNIGLQ